MQTAQTLPDRFVDGPVIRHGGLPAHAADQADGFHGIVPLRPAGESSGAAAIGMSVERDSARSQYTTPGSGLA
jgi:hypothetical protein